MATRLRGNIKVREENAGAAMEVMSHFALDPRWLVYLPPTISPCDSSGLPGMLEHPAEMLAYFRNNGVSSVGCEEKHMGSRAIVVVGLDTRAFERRFGITDEGAGACYTRTGRRFFEDGALEEDFVERVGSAIGEAGLWERLATDWLVLDSELMPWSVTVQDLLREQYAAVSAAARTSLTASEALLQQASERGIDARETFAGAEERLHLSHVYSDAYARYCWPVT